MSVHWRSQRGHKTKMQQFMLLLERDMYVHWCRCEEVSNVVQDIFWTHPESVKLVNSLNIVILMDTTYKTNKYRMSLLEVVGITSTSLTFFSYILFTSSRKGNNFLWALDKLKRLFSRADSYLRMVVWNRDIALMNAIRIVFHEAYNLLCVRRRMLKDARDCRCQSLLTSPCRLH